MCYYIKESRLSSETPLLHLVPKKKKKKNITFTRCLSSIYGVLGGKTLLNKHSVNRNKGEEFLI